MIYFSSDAQVDVYLSVTERAASGRSLYEDWVAVLNANKDDPSRLVLLRMEFGAITPEEISLFRAERMLVTKDIELNVSRAPTCFVARIGRSDVRDNHRTEWFPDYASLIRASC